MPPVVLLALVGAAGIAGYRLYSAIARARKSQPQRARGHVRDLGSLEWDESAGVYRPRSKHD